MMASPKPPHRVWQITYERKPWWVFWRDARLIEARWTDCYCPLAGDHAG